MKQSADDETFLGEALHDLLLFISTRYKYSTSVCTDNNVCLVGNMSQEENPRDQIAHESS